MRIDRVKFAAALARKDMTICRLSELCMLSRNTITSVKHGKSCSKETAEKLAMGLGLEVSDLLEEA